MPGPKKEIEGTSIVLLGQFNPTIFQPAWFGAQKLIRVEEADAAVIEIIHPSIVRFTADWLTLEVSQDRFAAETTNPACVEALRDLVAGTFTVLEHTPFSKAGMNSTTHFTLPSTESWHALGHLLAPKQPWDGLLVEPGLRSVTLRGRRSAAAASVTHVTVEPSLRVLPNGVYINVNEEFEQAPGPEAAARVLNSLLTEWNAARAHATDVADRLLRSIEET